MPSRRRWFCFLIALAVVASIMALTWCGLFRRFEAGVRDLMFILRGPRTIDGEVVVVTIDEPAIAELGRWPWPRSKHAEMLRILARQHPRMVVLDVLFIEPDRDHPEQDLDLAAATGESGNVILPLFFDVAGEQPVKLHSPYKDLATHAVGLGYANVFADPDGILRRGSLILQFGDALYASLPLATYAAIKHCTLDELGEFLESLPLDEDGRLLLNFAGPPATTFPYVSYLDLLKGRIPGRLLVDYLERNQVPEKVKNLLQPLLVNRSLGAEDIAALPLTPEDRQWQERLADYAAHYFQDKIVLVGGTAAGLFDAKAVPYAGPFPGIELHATLLENLLHRQWLTPLPRGWSGAIALGLALLMGWFLPRLRPMFGVVLSLLLTILLVIAGYLLFCAGLMLEVVPAATSCVAVCAGIYLYRLISEEREKKWIRALFSQYLSPKVIDVITHDAVRLQLGGEEREVTIFFSDIADFTSISETIGSTTRLITLLNEYMTLMSEVILEHDGLVDKYIGDAVMAFWNAPLSRPDHALQACLAALECQERLRKFRTRLEADGLPDLRTRIGINTGVATVGNMGSASRLNYTVIGDSVNLASRLEQANKTFGSRILISENTWCKVKDELVARPIDRLLVKGRQQVVQVYELLARRGELPDRLVAAFQRYEEALNLYYPNREYDAAARKFAEVLAVIPEDTVSRAYRNRCQEYIKHPPGADWNGVFVMTDK